MTKHILLVEDEPAIREMTKIALEREGHRVSGVEDAQSAIQLMETDPVDITLVDWMLPGRSGIELVRSIRKDKLTRHLPIIMLTAKSDDHDITTGLDAGADDYVTKPFSPRELNSRIRALLRRSADFGDVSVIEHGPVKLDMAAMQLIVNEQHIALGHTEFKLLQFLMKNAGRVYSRTQLLDHVWGRGTFIEERTVDVHILRLRKSLKLYTSDQLIETIRGAGYRFTATPGGPSV